jgi:hypothetical protein
MLMDLLAGASAAAFFPVLGWLGAGGMWAIPAPCILLIAACAAGWMEPSGRSVWIHTLVIMSPELVALACATLICEATAGPLRFECAWLVIFLALALLFTLALVGLSFAAFLIRRWATRAI